MLDNTAAKHRKPMASFICAFPLIKPMFNELLWRFASAYGTKPDQTQMVFGNLSRGFVSVKVPGRGR